jgi:hypothetical protein
MNQEFDRDRHEIFLGNETELESLPDEINLDVDAETQELTAYLDGELPPEEAARFEQRLNNDPSLLAQMQKLQRTWDAFDSLPHESIDHAFVRSTMELVVQEARNGVGPSRTHRAVRFRQPMLALIPVCLLVASFFAMRYIQTKPHRELIENLVMIENLDRYRMIHYDIAFLERLEQRQLFSDNEIFVGELDDLRNVVNSLDGSATTKRRLLDQPEHYLASLSRTEMQRLRNNYESYSKLSEPELAKLNSCHEKLMTHPSREQLTKTLNSFYEWLVALGASEKAGLLDLDGESRIAKISEIRSQQSRTALGKEGSTKLPLDRDEEYLLNWFDLTIKSHEALIRQRFPTIIHQHLREGDQAASVPIEQLRVFARRAPLKQLASVLMRVDRRLIQELIYQDIDLLRRGISYEAQLIIADQDPEDQRELIFNWIEAANQAKAAIPVAQLREFYEQLPAEKRDQLDRMSLEEWTSTLSRMYRERNTVIRIEDFQDLFLGGF